MTGSTLLLIFNPSPHVGLKYKFLSEFFLFLWLAHHVVYMYTSEDNLQGSVF